MPEEGRYLEKIAELVRDHLALDASFVIDRETSLKGLKIDSLDILEIIMKIEDEFGIEFPDEKVNDFHNLGDIVDYIKSVKES